MKKILVVFAVITALSLALTSVGQSRTVIKNLYTELEGVRDIRIYVADVKDSSGGQMKGMLEDTKKAIESEFDTRLSLDFKIVDSRSKADFIIMVDVEERIWLDHDPLDSDKGIGTPATVADMLLDEDYARMQADVVIQKGPNASRDVKKALRDLRIRGDVVWERELKATVTEGDMPEEASKPLIEKRLAHMIMIKVFGKKAKIR
ncbi:MAG: hypothetical protein GF409_04485 [Candidatus Omnitrophica bacterium]|nr:hypothetical protein [Candidatus Omnitrophota bacterium]